MDIALRIALVLAVLTIINVASWWLLRNDKA